MYTSYLSLIYDEPTKIKFEQIYEQYRYLMLWIAQDILRDHALAEDAVHEAFLRILDHMEKITPENCNRTRAFIVIITRNLALDLFRKRKKQAESDLEDYENILADDLSDPERVLLDKESSRSIMAALGSVKQSYADILTLHVVNELSYQEIASLLKITPENVRVRLHRGRKQLVQYLKDCEPIDDSR